MFYSNVTLIDLQQYNLQITVMLCVAICSLVDSFRGEKTCCFHLQYPESG